MGITFAMILFSPFSIFQIDIAQSTSRYTSYMDETYRYRADKDAIVIGLYLQNQNTDESVAVFPAGIVPYFSRMYTYDMLGKSEEYIANLEETVGIRPGHNKFDSNYILQKKPTYIYMGAGKYGIDENLTFKSIDDASHPWLFDLVQHPLFQQYCYPNIVETNTDKPLYKCEWWRPIWKL